MAMLDNQRVDVSEKTKALNQMFRSHEFRMFFLLKSPLEVAFPIQHDRCIELVVFIGGFMGFTGIYDAHPLVN